MPDAPDPDESTPTAGETPDGAAEAGEAGAVGSIPVVTPDRTARGGWVLLAVMGLLTVVLVTALAVVDVQAIADDDWRTAALWAAAGALVALAVGLVATVWRLTPPGRSGRAARILVTIAIVAVVGGVGVIGLAQEQGGEAEDPEPVAVAEDSAATTDEVAVAGFNPDLLEPVGMGDALDIDTIVRSSLPVDVRTTVALELTLPGRQLVAEAAGCRPRDFTGATLGVAIGGTWAQPLVLVGRPLNSNQEPIERCHNAIVLLPIEAGLALPQ